MNLKKYILIAIFMVSGYAHSHVHLNGIEIREAFVRPTTSKSTAAYMDIINTGKKDDILTHVTILDRKAIIETHKTVIEDGIAQMVPVNKLMIPAGQTVHLAPKGIHIMIMGLEAPIKDGETVSLELHFQEAGKIPLVLPVRKHK
jgi:periplasmic copper chaperone A